MQNSRLTLIASIIMMTSPSAHAQLDCVVGNFYCSPDCIDLEYCSSSGPVVVETCTNGTLCNYVTKTCDVGSECPEPPALSDFQCHAQGYFPDPVECTAYHFCCEDQGNSTMHQCPSHSAYDPLTSLCQATQEDRVCSESPVPECESTGQLGPQLENPNIYYLCRRAGATITPSLFKCPPDQVFETNKCVLRTQIQTTTTTTIAPSAANNMAASSLPISVLLTFYLAGCSAVSH